MFITKNDYKLQSESSLRKRAQILRLHSTPAEQLLWKYLRNKQLDGIKFRRQHTLYGYIVDFYCYKHDLVIEVDGLVHQNHQAHDDGRDLYLQNRGYTILRFTNEQVLNNITYVLKTIQNHLSSPEEERDSSLREDG